MMPKAGALLFFLALIIGCEPVSDDMVAPQIDLFALEEDTLSPSDLLSVAVAVSDDEALNQMRIRISDAFSKAFGAWTDVRIEDLSGTNFQTNLNFTVPDTALAGFYQIAFQVVDMRGNASIDSVRFFTIVQPGITPIFNELDTEPPSNSSFVIEADSTGFLRFIGDVDDAVGLESVEIQFRRANGNNLATDTYDFSDTLVTNWSFALNVDTFFFSDFSVNPASVVVRAVNNDGHQARRAFNFDFGL